MNHRQNVGPQIKQNTTRKKERKKDFLLRAGCNLQRRRMMRIKTPAELKTFPCLPPLFKVGPIFALELSVGLGRCRKCSLGTSSADVSGKGHIHPWWERIWTEAEASLTSCHLIIETSNYGPVQLMSCHAWPCGAVRASTPWNERVWAKWQTA